MRYFYSLPLLCLFALFMMPQHVKAAFFFEPSALMTTVTEGVKTEGRELLMSESNTNMSETNDAITNADVLSQQFQTPTSDTSTPLSEWEPIVPKNVAETLKDADTNEPNLDTVHHAVNQVVFLNDTNHETLRISRNQQDVLALKTLVFGYAASNRSMAQSEKSTQETQQLATNMSTAKTQMELWTHIATLQMRSMRKMAEILHLHSRQLEIHSALNLRNKARPQPLNKEN